MEKQTVKSKANVLTGDITLIDGIHFSRSGLATYLNEKHGGKIFSKKDNQVARSGKFTTGDIQQYAIRGKLPTQYGGHEIVEIKHKYLGLFVKVDFSK